MGLEALAGEASSLEALAVDIAVAAEQAVERVQAVEATAVARQAPGRLTAVLDYYSGLDFVCIC